MDKQVSAQSPIVVVVNRLHFCAPIDQDLPMRALSTKELAFVIVSQALKPSVIELHNPRALNALTLVFRTMNEQSLA
mgnify:FL=1